MHDWFILCNISDAKEDTIFWFLMSPSKGGAMPKVFFFNFVVLKVWWVFLSRN
jgi:hypothetical protein